jgi:S1-C subfamily serine protease
VFPPELTVVGREHCAIRRESGRYRLSVGPEHLVTIDGRPADDGDALVDQCELQLGPNGPRLIVQLTTTSALEPTDEQGRRFGTSTAILQVRRSARRSVALAALALAALGIACWLGVRAWLDNRDHIAGVGKQITQMSGEQQRRFRALEAAELAQAESRRAIPEGWATLLEHAEPSIYVVLIRSAAGIDDAIATSFVVDQERGLLATNAHVAEDFFELAPGESMHVLASGGDSTPVRIVGVTIHPGRDQFNQLWDDYDPVLPISADDYRSIDSAGPGCDVALMQVEAGATLNAALPIAPEDVLLDLRPGEPVAYLGFPMEGLALGGINPQLPSPKAQLGYVSDVTDYFGSAAPDRDQRLLVHHALAASGGASGSPMINQAGQVIAVHNAMNPIGQTQYGRIQSSAGIFFGQRADLVRELLDGTAEEHQRQRLETWTRDVRRFFRERIGMDRVLIQKVVTDFWIIALTELDLVSAVPQTVTELRLPLEPDDAGTGFRGEWEVVAEESGSYMVLVFANDQDVALRMEVLDAVVGSRYRTDDFDMGWHDNVRLTVDAGVRLTIKLEADQASEVDIVWQRAQQTKLTPDEWIAERVRAWQSDGEPTAVDRHAELVTDGTLELIDQGGTMRSINLPYSLSRAGDYMLVAHAADGQDLDMELSAATANVDFEQWDRIVEDRRIGPGVMGTFSISEPIDIDILFTAPNQGNFRYWLYFMEPTE